ncbi:MAG: type II toxin-antitoxin system VapC family toxin [Leptolyngbyaceae cyanobacterium CAN_BIN12]|nr:type II toxin-antitoxin system VapC family toxin [Leptolyngbyaceae cyanobacterium CAN_BIN12]
MILLDTHVLLWYLLGNPNLSNRVKEMIDTKTDLHFSMASLWEISIKVNIGKLKLNRPFQDLPEELNLINAVLLPISAEDTQIYVSLPLPSNQRDPFDRILVAQAINFSLTIASADAAFDAYPIQRVWV